MPADILADAPFCVWLRHATQNSTATKIQLHSALDGTHMRKVLILLFIFSIAASEADVNVPSCFDNDVVESRKLDLDHFDDVKNGMKRQEIIKLIGNPSCLGGSGIAYDVYLLSDDRRVHLAYSKLPELSWGFVSDSNGNNRIDLF